jgi:hypothetical protein
MGTPQSDVAITKTQRWLDLIAFLVQHHFPVAVDDIMEAVAAYRGKWRKDELPGAGVPDAFVRLVRAAVARLA